LRFFAKMTKRICAIFFFKIQKTFCSLQPALKSTTPNL